MSYSFTNKLDGWLLTPVKLFSFCRLKKVVQPVTYNFFLRSPIASLIIIICCKSIQPHHIDLLEFERRSAQYTNYIIESFLNITPSGFDTAIATIYYSDLKKIQQVGCNLNKVLHNNLESQNDSVSPIELRQISVEKHKQYFTTSQCSIANFIIFHFYTPDSQYLPQRRNFFWPNELSAVQKVIIKLRMVSNINTHFPGANSVYNHCISEFDVTTKDTLLEKHGYHSIRSEQYYTNLADDNKKFLAYSYFYEEETIDATDEEQHDKQNHLDEISGFKFVEQKHEPQLNVSSLHSDIFTHSISNDPLDALEIADEEIINTSPMQLQQHKLIHNLNQQTKDEIFDPDLHISTQAAIARQQVFSNTPNPAIERYEPEERHELFDGQTANLDLNEKKQKIDKSDFAGFVFSDVPPIIPSENSELLESIIPVKAYD